MAKVRLYELAKELGIDSKTLMAKVSQLGEFVRSPSSTLEPPTVQKLRSLYPVSAEVRRPSRPRPQRPRDSPPSVYRQPADVRPAVPTAAFDARSLGSPALDAAAAIFGADAVRRTTRERSYGRETYRDGYGWEWQRRLIEHEEFEQFVFAGLSSNEAVLAERCLMAGVRPAELSSRLGDQTVLQWIRHGHDVFEVAQTLRECQADPKSAYLIDAPARDQTA